jgi:hypothetical protein
LKKCVPVTDAKLRLSREEDESVSVVLAEGEMEVGKS